MTITKIVSQRSRELNNETLDFLRGIAADYAKVKTAVYERYSGVRYVNRLTPVYDIQNEMRGCGLRGELNLPVVYYELAVSEAAANIKTGWSRVKEKIREAIRENENLGGDELKYIRTVLKLDDVYAAILNRREYEMPKNMEGAEIDIKRPRLWEGFDGAGYPGD